MSYVSEKPNNFRTELGLSVFKGKYALTSEETWLQRAQAIVDDVCGTRKGTVPPLMSKADRKELAHRIHTHRFLPGGRYIYYAGRGVAFYSNCLAYRGEEDTREEWGRLCHSASDALMSGSGIGIDYSVFRERGALLSRTGGTASGPLPLAKSINEIGRNVMQGGSRRSAIYGSLNWQHPDAPEWLAVKDWDNVTIPGTDITYGTAKRQDFNASAPLDSTNISLNYDDEWIAAILRGSPDADTTRLDLDLPWTDPDRWTALVENAQLPETFVKNVEMALRNGEPGFSFNFRHQQRETLRNACTEFVSEDDSDVCNLGSINMAAIEDLDDFKATVELASKFLVCGTIRGQLPDEKSRRTREKNRRLGLGLMGMHEWLLQRGHRYGFNGELNSWLQAYVEHSESAANEHCDRFFLSRPVAYRAIAPTGTIGILAGSTTGIEPIFAVAYKRRYIDGNRETGIERRMYQYYVDAGAQDLINRYDIDPNTIESAIDLAQDPIRRLQFQADVQFYVDMAISSTINLPAWGSEYNNPDLVDRMARAIATYAPRLRGLTTYPDGARGGQPLVSVPYEEAINNGLGIAYEENSENACKSGVCGI